MCVSVPISLYIAESCVAVKRYTKTQLPMRAIEQQKQIGHTKIEDLCLVSHTVIQITKSDIRQVEWRLGYQNRVRTSPRLFPEDPPQRNENGK